MSEAADFAVIDDDDNIADAAPSQTVQAKPTETAQNTGEQTGAPAETLAPEAIPDHFDAGGETIVMPEVED